MLEKGVKRTQKLYKQLLEVTESYQAMRRTLAEGRKLSKGKGENGLSIFWLLS